MRKILKNICLVFMFVFCMFFINTNGVQAKECYCYYQSASINGNSYYYKIKFTENSADIVAGKETTWENQYNANSFSQEQTGIQRGTPFKINSKNIVKNNCSIDICQTANVRVKKKDDANETALWKVLVACDSNCSDNKTLCGGVCSAEEKALWKTSYKLNATDENTYNSVGFGENSDSNGRIPESNENSGVSVDDIKNWGTDSAANSLYGNNSLNACSVISEDLKDLLNKALSFISVAGVLILIIMSMIEFVKAITGANDDLIKTALKHTIIRIVCAIILFLLPMLVTAVIDVVNDLNVPITDENGNVVIGEDGNPLCGVGNKQK